MIVRIEKMVYSLKYRRPSYRKRQETLSLDTTRKSIDDSVSASSSRISGGIPDALSFDRIVSGGTCPVSLQGYINISAYCFGVMFLKLFLFG